MNDPFIPYTPKAILPKCLIIDETEETILERALGEGGVRVIDTAQYTKYKHSNNLLICRTTEATETIKAIIHCNQTGFRDFLFIAGLCETQIKGIGLESGTRGILQAINNHQGPVIFLERKRYQQNATYEAIYAQVPWAYFVSAETTIPVHILKEPIKHRTNTASSKKISTLLPQVRSASSSQRVTKEIKEAEDNVPSSIERYSVDELKYLLKILKPISKNPETCKNTAIFMISQGLWPSDHDLSKPNPPSDPAELRRACEIARTAIKAERQPPVPPAVV